MNSLEALERFKLLYESKCKEQPKNLIGFDMCYIAIKQDLERKEQLEKENEDLKVFVDAYANARDELLIRNEQLEKENLELKDKIQVLEQSVKDTYDTSQEIIVELKEEKEKWRKLCLCWKKAYIECDEKFHNLLKEVLKDEE